MIFISTFLSNNTQFETLSRGTLFFSFKITLQDEKKAFFEYAENNFGGAERSVKMSIFPISIVTAVELRAKDPSRESQAIN
jgi:hypothetical protein